MALDANAETLWRVLLKKVGVTISKGAHIEDKRAWVLRNFGVPDLAHRLSVRQQIENGGPQDDVARAVIWRHVAEASSPGDSITDLSQQNRFLLNPFIVPKNKKFANPLAVLRKEMPFGDEKMIFAQRCSATVPPRFLTRMSSERIAHRFSPSNP
jgi:hypothetical protein